MIVWGRDEEEHLNNLRKVFDRFRDAGVTLRRDKCTFMTTSVKYLGHSLILFKLPNLLDWNFNFPLTSGLTLAIGCPWFCKGFPLWVPVRFTDGWSQSDVFSVIDII